MHGLLLKAQKPDVITMDRKKPGYVAKVRRPRLGLNLSRPRQSSLPSLRRSPEYAAKSRYRPGRFEHRAPSPSFFLSLILIFDKSRI